MRRRDLFVYVLLAGLVVFFVRQMPSRTDATSPIAASVTVEPQGRVVDSAAPAPDAPSVEVVRSSEPPPARDDALVRIMIRDGAPGTYLLEQLHENNQFLTRWPDRRTDLLRVWIDRQPNTQGWDPNYPLVAERAFGEWREAGFPITFVFHFDSANADIKVRWVDRLGSEGRRIGVTNGQRDQNGWIVSAEIIVATHDQDGRVMPASLVAGVVRHELGHALGLGHSPHQTDVMYPESHTTTISQSDRATLHLLYLLPPGLVK